MRTFVYVDGFNLYYEAVKGAPYKWLDIHHLCQLLLPKNPILKIKYFTALVSARPNDPDQPNRQQVYLRALRTIPDPEIIYGHFLEHEVTMPVVGSLPSKPGYAREFKTEEKGSDVNIAAHMINDGYKGEYQVAKKTNAPGETLSVAESLAHVRRMVVDFVVGRVLSEAGEEDVSGLDAVTTCYLLHRHDFGMSDSPAGPCILYAVSCGLSNKDLVDRYDVLSRKDKSEVEIEDEDTEESQEAGEESDAGSSVFRLKAWSLRKRPNMGYDPHLDRQPTTSHQLPGFDEDAGPAIEIPLIDQVHRIMQLWRGGDVSKVDEYLDLRWLRRSQLFHLLLQSLIELAAGGSEERSILESISNHIRTAAIQAPYQSRLIRN